MWLTLPAGHIGVQFRTKMFLKIHSKFFFMTEADNGPTCTVSQAPLMPHSFVLQSPRLSSRQDFGKNRSISQRVFWETMTTLIDIFAFILNIKWDDPSRLEGTGLFKLNSKMFNLTATCFYVKYFFF